MTPRYGKQKDVIKEKLIEKDNIQYEEPYHFAYDIIMGFRQLAEPQGFDVVIEPVDIQIQRNQPYDVYMLEHDYVGSFVIGFSLADPWLKDFENSCTPTVLYDNYITGNPSTAYVGIDNDEGMELAVSHLVRQGQNCISQHFSWFSDYPDPILCFLPFYAQTRTESFL